MLMYVFCVCVFQASLQAELSGVAAFFLSGMRRFVFRDWSVYFRILFHWTRQAAAGPPPRFPYTPRHSGTSVDPLPR